MGRTQYSVSLFFSVVSVIVAEHFSPPNHRMVSQLSGRSRWRRDVNLMATHQCNDYEESRWKCTCIDCNELPCCQNVIDSHLVLQSVTILLKNATYQDFFNQTFEPAFRTSIAGGLSSYCHTSPSDCVGIFNTSNDGTTSTTASELPRNVINDRAVVIVSALATEYLNIAFFVLSGSDFHVANGDAVAVDAGWLQAALRNQTELVTQLLGYSVEIYVKEDAALPIRAIIAGAFLGFFLVLSCMVSAIKAVRDRKLIKTRNAIKREVRRHKDLRNSIRKTSPRKSKSDFSSQELVKENGDVITVAAPSNGDVRSSSPMSSHVIQVIVHSGCDTEFTNEKHTSSNEVSQDIVASNHNSSRDHIPNGHLTDATRNGRVQTMVGEQQEAEADVGYQHTLPAPNRFHVPDDTGEDIEPRSEEPEGWYGEGANEFTDTKPGVVNPAYDASDKF